MCVSVFPGPATHDLNVEPQRSLLARRRILLDGFPLAPQYSSLRVDERLLDARDVLQACRETGLVSADASELLFLLRHTAAHHRVELQMQSEQARDLCLSKKAGMEQRFNGLTVWPGESALGGAAVTPAPPAVAPQQRWQPPQVGQFSAGGGPAALMQPPQYQQPPYAPAAAFPAPPPAPAPMPIPAPLAPVVVASSPSNYPFVTPLSGVPSTPSAASLFGFYGLPPTDNSVLFDFVNAPYAVFRPDPQDALQGPVREAEIAARREEVRRRQVLLCFVPAPTEAFAPGPAGDAARLADARSVFASLSRAYSLPPGVQSDLSIRSLFRLPDHRVVLQLASESMVDALRLRDQTGMHQLGWAVQRTDGGYLVPPPPPPPQQLQPPPQSQPQLQPSLSIQPPLQYAAASAHKPSRWDATRTHTQQQQAPASMPPPQQQQQQHQQAMAMPPPLHQLPSQQPQQPRFYPTPHGQQQHR